MIEVVITNKKTNKTNKYTYFTIQYNKVKHINSINKGVKKSYKTISEHDITTKDININNSKINATTLSNITQYTTDKNEMMNNCIDYYSINKVLTVDKWKFILKFHFRLYEKTFNNDIELLYNDEITKEQLALLLKPYKLEFDMIAFKKILVSDLI